MWLVVIVFETHSSFYISSFIESAHAVTFARQKARKMYPKDKMIETQCHKIKVAEYDIQHLFDLERGN